MAWWERNNLRLIQNNLRESDANLDVDLLISELQRLSTNVLMINAGGIVAFYPTQLEYHYRAAGQQKDLLAEAIEKAHKAGMKLIARFDFSKAHESIYARKPEWFYRTRKGEAVNYHGIVHTCINGEYQREYSLKLIDEVISNYDVDGIFFNMFGYQTQDYSGHDYGICCCDSCRTRFRDWSGGLELPETESLLDPTYRSYKQFQQATTREMLDRIHTLVKSRPKDIAISTYNEHKVDIVRKESNTDPIRPHPVWLYSASENIQSLEDSWDDKLVSNCSINAIDLIHRFTGVSSHEVNIRLKQNIASGSGLDFCIIGVFDGYPDRENLPTVAEVFNYHRRNEAYYGRFLSAADIALIKPGGPIASGMKEYSGWYKALKEHHLLFDVLHQNALADQAKRLGNYQAIIVPAIEELTEDQLRALEEAYRQGVRLLATGSALTAEGENRDFLERVFDIRAGSRHTFEREAAYFQTADKTVFRHFPERDWVIVKGTFMEMSIGSNAKAQLPFVEPSTFGPPERAFGHRLSTERFGASICTDGPRASVYVPWSPGELYYRYGYEDHKHIVLDLLEQLMTNGPKAITNAPHNVELFVHRLDERTHIVHLLNLSGFNGITYFEPVPVHGIQITLRGIGEAASLKVLASESSAVIGPPSAHTNTAGQPEAAQTTGDVMITLPELRDFAAFVVQVETPGK
ncbi:alpha-amylase family protein [Paenibacillus periandrae]|uniref:alpha-amylase family protein n=1 Tax=Paenibacillus periandrae TaxID=1761741 RepID=UPI001F09E122|nr:alpha-amylase family protein [Paenibacillus periandrae]